MGSGGGRSVKGVKGWRRVRENMGEVDDEHDGGEGVRGQIT